MSIKTGTSVGNGSRRSVSIGWKPEVVICIPDAAKMVGIKLHDLWAGRTNVLGASNSYADGATLTKDGFTVSQSPKWNDQDITYHHLAISRSAALKMALAGSQGNAIASRAIKFDDSSINLAAVIAKRDSTRDGVLQVGSSTTALLGGTALTESGAITNLTTGQCTVSASGYVNEYDAAQELGEGIDFIGFETGENFATATYTGSGANRAVSVGFQPKAVIVAKISGTLQSAWIKTDTMSASGAKQMSAAAGIVASGISFDADGLQLTAGSALNINTANYVVIAFRDHADTPIAAPAVKKSGKKAVLLSARGTTSWVNCGTDNSLVLDGAISMEWMGGIEPTTRTNASVMMWRGASTSVSALQQSLFMGAIGWVGLAGNWSGPIMAVGCSDRMDFATSSTNILNPFRTGLIPDYGNLIHWLATHDGSGGWMLYRNGQLVRQRALDMVAINAQPNIDGQTGHRMILGAAYNAGAPVQMSRQRVSLARLYNRALTPSEVASRFARAGLGSSETDVTSGLVEEWDAINASGSTLPATIASANNGAVVGGSIIAL